MLIPSLCGALTRLKVSGGLRFCWLEITRLTIPVYSREVLENFRSKEPNEISTPNEKKGEQVYPVNRTDGVTITNSQMQSKTPVMSISTSHYTLLVYVVDVVGAAAAAAAVVVAVAAAIFNSLTSSRKLSSATCHWSLMASISSCVSFPLRDVGILAFSRLILIPVSTAASSSGV